MAESSSRFIASLSHSEWNKRDVCKSKGKQRNELIEKEQHFINGQMGDRKGKKNGGIWAKCV